MGQAKKRKHADNPTSVMIANLLMECQSDPGKFAMGIVNGVLHRLDDGMAMPIIGEVVWRGHGVVAAMLLKSSPKIKLQSASPVLQPCRDSASRASFQIFQKIKCPIDPSILI